jgi:uncharacterized protein (TIGR02246 family)
MWSPACDVGPHFDLVDFQSDRGDMSNGRRLRANQEMCSSYTGASPACTNHPFSGLQSQMQSRLNQRINTISAMLDSVPAPGLSSVRSTPKQTRKRKETEMRGVWLLVIGLFLLAVACQRQAPVDTPAADERAIRTADATCLKAAQAKDTEGVLSCYADDASWLPPNAPMLTGKEAIRTGWSQLLASPGFAISWQITKLQVSRSGDLAYALYSYELAMQGPDAKPITDRGKDMAVWSKQPDGGWRIVADTYNSDQPPAAAKPAAAKKKTKGKAGRHRHIRRR